MISASIIPRSHRCYECPSDRVGWVNHKASYCSKFTPRIADMRSYYRSDNASIEWNKGNQAFKLYNIHVSELGGITDMPCYHCSDSEA